MIAARTLQRLAHMGPATALAVSLVSVASAQPVVPAGIQFHVNTSTSGYQLDGAKDQASLTIA